MDERVKNTGEDASNEEYKKLNTDFLLLSALIKDHKARKAQQLQSSPGSRNVLPHKSSHSKSAQLTFPSNVQYVTNKTERGKGSSSIHMRDTLQGFTPHSKDRNWVGMKNHKLVKYQIKNVSREIPRTSLEPSGKGKMRNIHGTVSNMNDVHKTSLKHLGANVKRTKDMKEGVGLAKTGTSKSNLEAKLLATKQAVIENRQKIEWLTKQAEKARSIKRDLLGSDALVPSSGSSLGRTSSSCLREGSLPVEGTSLYRNPVETNTEKRREPELPVANHISFSDAQKSDASLNPNNSSISQGGTKLDANLKKGQVLQVTHKGKPLYSKDAVTHSKSSASKRLDTIRTAHEESLKTLEKASKSPSSSKQMQEKNCEIARVQALSAYLTKLKEKKAVEGDNSAAESSSKSSRKCLRGRIPATDNKDIFRLPRSISKLSQVRTGNVATNSPGHAGACHALPRIQQADLTDKTKGKVGQSRCLPSQNSTKDSPENDEVRRLKSEIKILNAKINSKHLKDKKKGNSGQKSKYVWTPHCKDISGRNNATILTAKKRKILKRKTPQVVSRSVNRFVKINPSLKLRSTASGNRSLVKTRTRYKIRKSYQKSTPRRMRGNGQEQGRPRHDKRIPGVKMRSGRSTSKSLRRNEEQYPPHIHLRKRVNPSKQYHHHSRSTINNRNCPHGQQYSPYKRAWTAGRKRLWDRYERPSFVTRRLQYMVEHSPMLFRYSPFLGRQMSVHRLDQIWHRPRIMDKRLHLQVKRTSPRMQTSSKKLPSTTTGGRQSKKVMNVVNINGVRYSRHGKSLKRLAGTSVEKGKKVVTPTPSQKVTNTKIVAQDEFSLLCNGYSCCDTSIPIWTQHSIAGGDYLQVLQRSIFLSRTLKLRKARKQEYCMFFNRFGRCHRGSSCPYKHDPDKVAICTRFLRGMCNKASGFCPFSHKVSKDKMPVCRFFLKGICTQVDCPYSHVKVSNSASICKDFVQGYCARGEKCTKKHLLECAEYSQKGSCPRKFCPLWHKKRLRSSGQGQQKGRHSNSNSRTFKGQGQLTTSRRGSSFIELTGEGEENSSTEMESGLEDKVTQPLQIRPVFQNVTNGEKA